MSCVLDSCTTCSEFGSYFTKTTHSFTVWRGGHVFWCWSYSRGESYYFFRFRCLSVSLTVSSRAGELRPERTSHSVPHVSRIDREDILLAIFWVVAQRSSRLVDISVDARSISCWYAKVAEFSICVPPVFCCLFLCSTTAALRMC